MSDKKIEVNKMKLLEVMRKFEKQNADLDRAEQIIDRVIEQQVEQEHLIDEVIVRQNVVSARYPLLINNVIEKRRQRDQYRNENTINLRERNDNANTINQLVEMFGETNLKAERVQNKFATSYDRSNRERSQLLNAFNDSTIRYDLPDEQEAFRISPPGSPPASPPTTRPTTRAATSPLESDRNKFSRPSSPQDTASSSNPNANPNPNANRPQNKPKFRKNIIEAWIEQIEMVERRSFASLPPNIQEILAVHYNVTVEELKKGKFTNKTKTCPTNDFINIPSPFIFDYDGGCCNIAINEQVRLLSPNQQKLCKERLRLLRTYLNILVQYNSNP